MICLRYVIGSQMNGRGRPEPSCSLILLKCGFTSFTGDHFLLSGVNSLFIKSGPDDSVEGRYAFGHLTDREFTFLQSVSDVQDSMNTNTLVFAASLRDV